MIFAPVIRRAAYAQAPRPADLALQRFLLGTVAESAASRSAGCTVTQDDKATTLQLDVPGLTREQLQIRIEGNVVRLHSVEGAPPPRTARVGAGHRHRCQPKHRQTGKRRAHPHAGQAGARGQVGAAGGAITLTGFPLQEGQARWK